MRWSQPLLRVDCRAQLSSPTVALKQIAEMQDRLPARQRLAQVEPGEATHRLGCVELVLDARVGDVVVELHAVNVRHRRQRIGRPPVPRLDLEGPDARLQFCPGDQPVGAFEEPFAARRAPLPLGFHAGQRPLTPSGGARPLLRAPVVPSRADSDSFRTFLERNGQAESSQYGLAWPTSLDKIKQR